MLITALVLFGFVFMPRTCFLYNTHSDFTILYNNP